MNLCICKCTTGGYNIVIQDPYIDDYLKFYTQKTLKSVATIIKNSFVDYDNGWLEVDTSCLSKKEKERLYKYLPKANEYKDPSDIVEA